MNKSILSEQFDINASLDDRAEALRALKVLLEARRHRLAPALTEEFLGDPAWRSRMRTDLVVNMQSLQRSTATLVDLENMVGASMAADMHAMTAEQSTAEWTMVAWEIVDLTQPRRARTKAEQAQAQRYSIFEDDADSPKGSPARKVVKTIHERSWQVRLAYIDLRRNVEVDVWEQRTRQKDSVMAGQGVPLFLQRQYDAARDLVKRFYAGLGVSEGEREVEVVKPGVSADPERLAAAKALLQGGAPLAVVVAATGLSEALLEDLDAQPAAPKKRETTKKAPPKAGTHIDENAL